MTPEGHVKLKTLLVQHENYKQFPYSDSTGNLTVGIGRNLTARGVSPTEALYLLDDDISYFANKLAHYLPFFDGLLENRQIALIDMCFNVGVQGFLNFKRMIYFLSKEEYDNAANEIMDSLWANQVHERATCIANIIRSGNI